MQTPYATNQTHSNLELFALKLHDKDAVLINLETLFMRSMEDVFNASFPLEIRYESETPEKERWLREQRETFRALNWSNPPKANKPFICQACKRPTGYRYVIGRGLDGKRIYGCKACKQELKS